MMNNLDDMNDYIKKFKNQNNNSNQPFNNNEILEKCNSNNSNFNSNQNIIANMNNNNNFSNNMNNNIINFHKELNIKQDFSRQKFNSLNLEENYSFSRYKKAINTGFKDLGNSSYLNSVFQLLGSISEFADYFLNPTNIKNIYLNLPKMQLSHLIQRLFVHLYPYPEKNEKEIYSPIYHLDYLNKHKIEKNPNSILDFIFKNLHNELNKLSNNIYMKIKPNIYELDNVILNGIENYRKLNDSIISNLFNWFEIKESECIECKQKSYLFENYTIFNLDILNSFNYYKINNINNNRNNNCFSIYHCLDYKNIIKKEELLYCNKCLKYESQLTSKIIYNFPRILICSLNRGVFDTNLMSIPFYIHDKITIKSMQESIKEYELTGIVSIYLDKNKYVSSCKSPVDLKWYFYNDEYIGNADFNAIIKNHNEKKMFLPCLLIYKSISA